MNIACTVCPARYAIPDVKIVGRKVRITCKRCGARLTIDGTQDPPGVIAEESLPPAAEPEPAIDPDRFLVALAGERQESLTVSEIVQAYGTGTVDARTFAWRADMSGWKLLFDIDVIGAALQNAGYSPDAPARYGEDDDAPTHAAYNEDDEGVTHARSGPAGDDDATHVRSGVSEATFADEDEATHVFDSESLGAGAWNEPANWKKQGGRGMLAAAEWREKAAVREVPRMAAAPAGAWEERGLEEDEVTRMVAPLEEQQYLAPPSSQRQVAPASQRQAPSSQRQAAPSSQRQATGRSSRPPSDDGDHLTGQRSDDSVLFTLKALTKNGPAKQPSAEATSHPVEESLLVARSPIAPLRADLDLLAPPSSFPPPRHQPPDARPSAPLSIEPPKRGGKFKTFLLLLLALCAAGLAGLYATGRWPLVTQTAMSVWEKVRGLSPLP